VTYVLAGYSQRPSAVSVDGEPVDTWSFDETLGEVRIRNATRGPLATVRVDP